MTLSHSRRGPGYHVEISLECDGPGAKELMAAMERAINEWVPLMFPAPHLPRATPCCGQIPDDFE